MKRSLIVAGIVAVFAIAGFAQADRNSRYEALVWHCGEWENEWKVTPGGHPAVVMFAERPETETQNRKICYATLESDEPVYQSLPEVQ